MGQYILTIINMEGKLMKNTWKKITVVTGIAIMLTACNVDNQEEAIDDTANINNVANHPTDLNDPSVIPSETGDKKETTNQHGSTYNGMGNDIYGSIGSSGIHEGGISSYFGSILEGEGITGVDVFVVDDSVILARNKEQTTSHKYDNLQNDVLRGTEGMSGKGEPKGVKDSQEESNDNLDQAKAEINDMFNGNVKILTVTNPKALDLIESIKENIKSESFEAASNDILELFKMSK